MADGTTAVVGRYRFERDRSDRNVGEFRYTASWARNDHGRAFALDPVNLPLMTETFFTTRRGGLFCVALRSQPMESCRASRISLTRTARVPC